MDKKLFNKIYAEFNKKDYFGNREFIAGQLRELKSRGIKVKLSQVKAVLYNERLKAYNMILNRIDTAREKGAKVFPLREKFTHKIFKILDIK
jgi:hypothetical protein